MPKVSDCIAYFIAFWVICFSVWLVAYPEIQRISNVVAFFSGNISLLSVLYYIGNFAIFCVIDAILWIALSRATNLPRNNYRASVLVWTLLHITIGFEINPQQAQYFVLPVVVRALYRLLNRRKPPEVINDEIEQVNKNNFCAIAFDYIRTPAIVSCCKKAFEKDDLREWLNTSLKTSGYSRCPNCGEEVTRVYTRSGSQSTTC